MKRVALIVGEERSLSRLYVRAWILLSLESRSWAADNALITRGAVPFLIVRCFPQEKMTAVQALGWRFQCDSLPPVSRALRVTNRPRTSRGGRPVANRALRGIYGGKRLESATDMPYLQ